MTQVLTDDYEEKVEYFEEPNYLSEDDSYRENYSFDSNRITPQYHVQKSETALHQLKSVVKEPGWKKVLRKSGVTVYSKPGVTKGDKLPVYMGDYTIEGFTPQSVFAVVGVRKLWDDWYEEGSLIENLNETTSLTYMVMNAQSGSQTRDLSLVEKIECTDNGTIYFVSTSIETPKVPRIPNRIRAHIQLNGWILEPLSYNPPQTRVVYVLQTQIKGWVPSIVAKTYLTRRPLVLHVIDQYLQKNGPPPIAISSTPHTPSDIPSNSVPSVPSNNSDVVEVKSPRRKISFAEPSEVAPKKHSSRQPSVTSVAPTVKEIQTDSLSHQDNSYSPEGPSSPKMPPLPVRTTSPMQHLSSTIDDVKPDPVKPIQHLHTAMNGPTEPIQHRHTASIQKALETFKSHVPLDGWEFNSEGDGVKIRMKKHTSKSVPIIRGDAVISGGFTIYDILSVIINLDTRKLWDERYDEGATYERFGLYEHLTRTAMKGTFPISGRDLSTCGMLDCDEDTGIIQFVTTSVIDPLVPESKKHVRSVLDFAGWQLKPHFDDDKKTTSVDVTYIVDIDIKLDAVPTSILKSLMNQIPTNIAKINGLMQKIGFPPYILNTTTKVITEKFNVKNYQCDLSLTAEKDGVTEFKISKLMYQNGINVSVIPEKCKVELLSTNVETIRVTLPSEVDLDIVTITINKRSEGYKMTYNNGEEIPMTLDSDGNDYKQSKHPKSITNATTLTNGKVEGYDNDKNYKPYSRGMISPETFVKPSEVPLKSEPYQRILEKQILLENKIAAVTQASREIQNVSVPLTGGPIAEKSIAGKPIVENPIVAKSKNEVIENNSVTLNHRKNLDSVRFNTHQVGLMFASMLLAYYAGKLSTL